jgi:hypothetical protein
MKIKNIKGPNTDPWGTPACSTSHQLIGLHHRILLALEAKQVTSVTFADI